MEDGRDDTVRRDWEPAGAEPIDAGAVIIRGKALAWYEKAWSHMEDAGSAIGDFVSKLSVGSPLGYGRGPSSEYFYNPHRYVYVPPKETKPSTEIDWRTVGNDGWLHTPLVSRYVGKMSYASPTQKLAGRENSFEQRTAADVKVGLELYAGGATIDFIAKPALMIAGKIGSRFISNEIRSSYALRREIRGNLAADWPLSARIDGLSPNATIGTSNSASYTERSVFASYSERTTLQMNSVSEQVDFLSRHVPGVNQTQATSILENGFSRDTSVVLGGSRIRGNYNGPSDLDVGFGSLTERQAQRVIKSINEGGFDVPLERLTIVPGKSTSTIERIISPEEFFQRSGIRAGGDLRAGEPYVASGSITFTKDGRIVVIPPGKF